MVRNLVTAEHVHGRTGLDGPVLPEPSMPLQKQYAVDFIIETLMNRPAGTVTLCTLGPLTNVALALVKEPRIASRIKRIVAMGGGFLRRWQCHAGRRIQHLCRSPCGAHLPVVGHSLHPHSAGLHPSGTDHRPSASPASAQMKNKSGPACADLLEFFERFDEQKYGTDGGPLHDPCVMAWLLKPELFQSSRDVNVCGGMRKRTDHGHDGD